MIFIGNHLSTAGGFLAMGKECSFLGGNTFAFFTRNPRGGKAKEIDPEDAGALREYCSSHQFGPLVAHCPYTMNLCSLRSEIRRFAKDMLSDDIARMEYLPGNYLNFHPGSHVGQGFEAASSFVAEALNRTLYEGMHTTVLLETMAGKGSEIGKTFEELAGILEKVRLRDHMGICLDTCHIWDGNYPIDTDLDGVLSSFDRILGLENLKAVHLNDSMNGKGAAKDRHEKLGMGKIGADTLRSVVTHPLLSGRPFILETPNDDEGYKKEIALVRSWDTP